MFFLPWSDQMKWNLTPDKFIPSINDQIKPATNDSEFERTLTFGANAIDEVLVPGNKGDDW